MFVGLRVIRAVTRKKIMSNGSFDNKDIWNIVWDLLVQILSIFVDFCQILSNLVE